MKKLYVAILLLCIGMLSACGRDDLKAMSDTSDITSEEAKDIADGMSITDEEDKEFIVLRVKDDYIEISGDCDLVYLEDGGKYPELADGQVAWVKADVAIYGGGIAGYTGNIFIRDLKQYEILDYKEVVDKIDVPDCENQRFEHGKALLQYQVADRCYFVVRNRQYIEVYLDGTLIKEYEDDDLDANMILAPFWAEVEKKENEYKQLHQEQYQDPEAPAEPVVEYGDKVHLICYRSLIGGEWKDCAEATFSADISAKQFQHGDYEMNEEELQLNVEEALGNKVGDSFTVSFEYGDCRVFNRYTILEIEKNSELGNQKDTVEYGDTITASHKQAERLAEYATEMEYIGDALLNVDEATTQFIESSTEYAEATVKDVVKKVQGKSRWSGSFRSCDEQYEYFFRVNMVNASYEPSYQLPGNWEYRFAPPKIGSFKGYNEESADAISMEEGELFGYDDRLTMGCSAWCGMEEYVCKAQASSTLPTQAGINYRVSNLTDGSRFSVWSEGVKGTGIGEYVEIKQMYMGSGQPELTFRSICIVNGYAENEEKWKENGRIKSLKLYYEDEYMGMIELADTMQPQYIDVTPVQMKVGNGFEANFRFEIAQVYEGSKYDDTCLTGIVIDFDGKYAH